jgi:hypothetical protein
MSDKDLAKEDTKFIFRFYILLHSVVRRKFSNSAKYLWQFGASLQHGALEDCFL